MPFPDNAPPQNEWHCLKCGTKGGSPGYASACPVCLSSELLTNYPEPKHVPPEIADHRAFAQMQRFVKSTGCQIEISTAPAATIIAWHMGSATGNTFAEAWAKFCAEWPEAGQRNPNG